MMKFFSLSQEWVSSKILYINCLFQKGKLYIYIYTHDSKGIMDNISKLIIMPRPPFVTLIIKFSFAYGTSILKIGPLIIK